MTTTGAADTVIGEDPAGRALELSCDLTRTFEGFSATPYLCPAGVWTIGYGSTFYLDGRRVMPTDSPISRETADRLLMAVMRRQYLASVLALCPGAVRPQQIAALADFAYNLGVGRLRTSTLRKRVNSGQWDMVPAELRKWVYGGGRRLPGLVRRREAEINLMGLA